MWLIAVAAMVVACSEDEGAPVTPSFPEEEQILSVKAGESVEIVFDASMDWKLYSSTLWCRFSNGMTSISGQAGKQAVQVSVNEDMLNYGEMQAEITLKQGDVEKVIAKLTRQGEVLLAVGEEGEIFTEESPLLLNFSRTSTTLSFTESFTLNFPWEFDQASLPEWLAVKNPPVKGGMHQKAELTVEITDDYLANEWTGNLRFKMQGEDRYADIPVKYTGLPADELVIRGISTKWNWSVSTDGLQYWTGGLTEGDDEPEKLSFPLSFRVLAKNSEYVVKAVYQDGKWLSINGVDDAEAFFDIKDDTHGNLELCNVQENTSAKRRGYILVFPKSVYDELSHGGTWPDMTALLNPEGTDLSEDVSDEYIVMAFDQEGSQISSVVPIKVNVNGAGDIDAIQGMGEITDPDVLGAINELGFADDANKNDYIFNYSVSAKSEVIITPYIKNYFGENSPIGSCEVRSFSDPLTPDSSIAVSKEGNTYENSNVYFQCGNESLLVIFKDDFGMVCKVLILNIQ